MPRIRPYNPSIKWDDYLFKSKALKNEEEKVRQWILRELIETYGYSEDSITIEERVEISNTHIRPDIVIRIKGKIKIIIEAKKYFKNLLDLEGFVKRQLKDYLKQTEGVFGFITDGKHICFVKRCYDQEEELTKLQWLSDIPTFVEMENGEIPLESKKQFIKLPEPKTRDYNARLGLPTQLQKLSNRIPWVQPLIRIPQSQEKPFKYDNKQLADDVIGILQDTEKETFIQKLFTPNTQTFYKNGKFAYSESNNVIKDSKVIKGSKEKSKGKNRGFLSLIFGVVILAFLIIGLGKIVSNSIFYLISLSTKKNNPNNKATSANTIQSNPTTQNQPKFQNSESTRKTTTQSSPNHSEKRNLPSNSSQSDSIQNIEEVNNESQNANEPNMKVYESDNWKETNTTKPSFERSPLPTQTPAIQPQEPKPTIQATPISTPIIEKKVEIFEATICSFSGKLPNQYCPSKVTRKFRKNETPTSICAEHKKKNGVVEFLKKIPNRIP